jgi:hypothetical protein
MMISHKNGRPSPIKLLHQYEETKSRKDNYRHHRVIHCFGEERVSSSIILHTRPREAGRVRAAGSFRVMLE